MSKYWLLLLLLLPLGVNAQKADFGSLIDTPLLDNVDVYQQSFDTGEIVPLVKVEYADTQIYQAEAGEILEERTAQSQTYANPDGSRTIKYYGVNVFTGANNEYRILADYLTPAEYNTLLQDKASQIDLLGFLSVSTVHAQATTSVETTKDNNLKEGSPTTNLGNSTGMAVGWHSSGANQKMRGIINFTLPAEPEAGAVIDDVKLYLYENAGNQGSVQYDVHQLTQTNWNETQSTWNVYSTGNNWASAGGDYSATIIDSNTCVTNGTWCNWTLQGTDATNPLDLGWEDNLDLLLKRNSEGNENWNDYYTSDQNGSEPYLLIEYSIEQAATTTATTTSCDMTAGTLDDDTIATYLLYWYYVILMFVILTIGYSLVDRIFHLFKGKR